MGEPLTFGSELRAARLIRGLSQSQLSDQAGISRRTLIRWEAGEVSPWVPEFRSVLDVLGLADEERDSLVGFLDTNRGRQALAAVRPETIGKRIKMARRRARFKHDDVAQAMGCNVSTVIRWEAGKLCPKSEVLVSLWRFLGVTERELQAFDAQNSIGRPAEDVRTAQCVLGILWPWDRDCYRLFDARFLSLLERLGDGTRSESGRNGLAYAKAAYAWMLSTCGRYEEALALSEEVLKGQGERLLGLNRFVFIATLVLARCEARKGSARAAAKAVTALDGLEKLPLDWELLACRYDGYAETFAIRGLHAKALEYSDRSVAAACRSGKRLEAMLRFNRSRVLLASGSAALALDGLSGFSDAAPLGDAGEALTMAAIHSALGRARAAHWQEVAASVINKYGLEPAHLDAATVWSSPSLFTTA